MNKSYSFSAPIGEHTITIETGKLAALAGGSVTVRVGDTIVFAAATMSAHPRSGINFFPLSVDFEERLYAVGRIPGSFFRREGRPHEKMILASRLIDRPLRPLFPSDMRNDVQIILSTLSSDQEHDMDVLGIVAASTALTISNIPFDGPVGGLRVGYIDGKFVLNPLLSEMADSRLNMRLAGTADAINMVEAGALEVSEEMIVEALKVGHQGMQPIIELQNEMRARLGKPKSEYTPVAVDEAVKEIVSGRVRGPVAQLVAEHADRDARNAAVAALREEVLSEYSDSEYDEADIREVLQAELKAQIRHRILDQGVRPDGRGPTDIRPLSAEVGLLPRAHGAGLFQRGETQVLTIATLGTPRDEQKLDDLYPDDSKRYMHHYNFPPYSTGETWFLRGTKRREVGHGALAEAALRSMIPPEDGFPYTIRLVSEVMASNGSTSMASVCGSTLALLDAGVPIKALVGGIAMGLVIDGDRHVVLTDIQGLEDHLGDMDFKVAGSREGITALQMDIKVKGLSYQILEEALMQARGARMQILDVLADCIKEPAELSAYAPRMLSIKISPAKIGAVIGKGGSTIRALQDEYAVTIDVEDDGTVIVAGVDGAKADEAIAAIEALTEDAEMGGIYTGKVVRLTDFGCFVEILPGMDGMVHISQLADYHVESVGDVVQMGDEIMVMVTDIDPGGKIRLSRQAVLEGWTLEEARSKDRPGSRRGGQSRGRPGGDRNRRPRRR
ncbi:MAG: polyribonucleotide nucleotidyltransferase [Ardenticatenales bacterium]|jgi:polyribonucleotide nucleotidyltransferase|nr:polyribonucleotide nucleotidyltransferase [Ardenticatenales bacterium]